MFKGIQKIEEIIEHIEKNLTSEIDYEALASRMALSVYEFRRIFSFVVGCPLSEYIRKRKLSLAACDLMADSKISIQQISERYGYSTLPAFSKAFSEYYGFSPTACRNGGVEISLFPRPKFEWNIQFAQEQSFRIIKDNAFSIKGFCAFSDHTDTCCCEGVWSDFYKLGKDKNISQDTLFVSYTDEKGKVKCCIGERIENEEQRNDTIPESQWLTVKMNTTDDDIVNKKYNSILYEILPSAKLRRKPKLPTVEVFPLDMSEDNFEWEIRIPVEKE